MPALDEVHDEEAGQEVKINFRARKDDRDLIDKAASVQRKTRTEFILETMRGASLDILLDQKRFFIDEIRWNDFTNALEAAPCDNPNLRKLLIKKSPWEE